MSLWERKKILIWGKTRPELSKTHKETVCTGGVFEDTKKFVRLYPIPLRYLDDERYFKKYQWIEADVRKAMRDARTESYNIRYSGPHCLDQKNAFASYCIGYGSGSLFPRSQVRPAPRRSCSHRRPFTGAEGLRCEQERLLRIANWPPSFKPGTPPRASGPPATGAVVPRCRT